jgi:hypothetical protein
MNIILERTGDSNWYFKHTYEKVNASGAAIYVKFLSNLFSVENDGDDDDDEDLLAGSC